MDLAVRTTASPGAIWAIVVVAVVLLAFWLFMVMVYANRPDPRFRQLAGMAGPALGGDVHADLGAAPQPETRVPVQRGPQASAPVADVVEPQAEPIPVQRSTPADAPQPANVEDGPPAT
jgi:hypothetical protein